MQAVEAVRLAPAPRPIPERCQQVTQVQTGGVMAERRTLPGVEDLVAASADRLALFSELGVDWAQPSKPIQSVDSSNPGLTGAADAVASSSGGAG
jgi:hypothetical protein